MVIFEKDDVFKTMYWGHDFEIYWGRICKDTGQFWTQLYS